MNKALGKLVATDGDGKNIDMTGKNAQIQQLLTKTKWDNTDKLGEGDFVLRLTVDKDDIVVELVDKSNFNGGKDIKTLNIII